VGLGATAAGAGGRAVAAQEGHVAAAAHSTAALDLSPQDSEAVGVEPALLDEELTEAAVLPLAKTLIALQQQLLEVALLDHSLFQEQLPPELLANTVHGADPSIRRQYGGGDPSRQGE